ncbi:hypothetical protein BJ944DRAFT_264203 [Cunninghamella echinulata]|nr:hypothetical protein BJ944DRAFT_264203 [Cunninghamella echinulata]
MVQYRNDLFANTFLTTHPKVGIATVQEKLKQGNILENEFAQYFKERALIEDQYAKSLVKASKKLYVMDRSVLGGLEPVWDLLHDELTEVSTAHGIIAYKIFNEIEQPLKTPASSDINKIKTMEPIFQQIAKEYEAGLKNKSGKTSLFKSVSKSHPEDALSRWTAEGNSFLQLYENVERARLERLKSIIINFEQIYSDQLHKRLEVANTILDAANEYNVDNDISEFCKSKSVQMNTLSSTASLSNFSKNTPDTTDHSVSIPIKSHSSDAINLSAKKVKSRFSILRKPKKSSSTTTNSSREQYVIPSIPENSEYNEEHHPNSIEMNSQPTVEHDKAGTFHHQIAESPSPLKQDSLNGISNNLNEIPKVDSEGYSIPFPDRFSQYIADKQDDESFNDLSTSQKLKFDIKNVSIQNNDNNQAELEKATLTRVSSILRENKPTISQRRRGRRQNMRLGSESDIEREPPSPLISNSNSTPISLNFGSTVSTSTDIITNPFRQLTPTSEHTNFSSLSPSPTLSSSRMHSKLYSSPTYDNNSNSHDIPILHTSVIESVNVQPGNQHATIIGQIKLVYNGPSLSNDATIKISFKNVHQIKPIHSSVHPIENQQQQEENCMFNIPAVAFEGQNKGTFIPFFSYQQEKKIDEVLPILLDPSWKSTENNVMMMIKYKLTHLYDHGQFMISTHLDDTTVTQVQSNPEGLWNSERQLFSWKGKDVLQHDHQLSISGNQQPRRLLAKFITHPSSSSPIRGNPTPHIALKYYCKDQPPISGILMETSLIDDKSKEDNAAKFQQSMDQLIVKSGTILF